MGFPVLGQIKPQAPLLVGFSVNSFQFEQEVWLYSKILSWEVNGDNRTVLPAGTVDGLLLTGTHYKIIGQILCLSPPSYKGQQSPFFVMFSFWYLARFPVEQFMLRGTLPPLTCLEDDHRFKKFNTSVLTIRNLVVFGIPEDSWAGTQWIVMIAKHWLKKEAQKHVHHNLNKLGAWC